MYTDYVVLFEKKNSFQLYFGEGSIDTDVRYGKNAKNNATVCFYKRKLVALFRITTIPARKQECYSIRGGGELK